MVTDTRPSNNILITQSYRLATDGYMLALP